MTSSVLIPRDICSGHDYIECYLCGLCGSLAVNWTIHDGAFGQPYCQRVFCGACVDSYCANLGNVVRGRSSIARVICPTPNCAANFQQPLFRSPSIFELTSYKAIIIKCPGCGRNFGPENYPTHRSTCNDDSTLVESFLGNSDSGVMALNPAVDSALRCVSVRDRRQFISFLSFGGRFERYTYSRITNMPNGVVLRIFFRNRFFRVQVNPKKDFSEFLDEIREYFRVSGEADLVSQRHVSLRACESFKEFIKSIPVGASINLTARRTCMADRNSYLSYELKASDA